jgi:hypothetical protein
MEKHEPFQKYGILTKVPILLAWWESIFNNKRTGCMSIYSLKNYFYRLRSLEANKSETDMKKEELLLWGFVLFFLNKDANWSRFLLKA